MKFECVEVYSVCKNLCTKFLSLTQTKKQCKIGRGRENETERARHSMEASKQDMEYIKVQHNTYRNATQLQTYSRNKIHNSRSNDIHNYNTNNSLIITQYIYIQIKLHYTQSILYGHIRDLNTTCLVYYSFVKIHTYRLLNMHKNINRII
jgi:hypothetical protein